MDRSKPRRVRLRWRILTYTIIAFNLLMLVWVIAGPAWIGTGCSVLGDTTCDGSADPGRRVAVSVVLALWALGDLILGGIWIATDRPRRRPCPRCGHDFHVGLQPRSGRYEPPGGHA
jgi:hypothetical protein